MEKGAETNNDFSNSSHTCITCRVVFARGELQREHYKSDWHRYNLKRKVAELPPVTAAVFQTKVLAQRQQVWMDGLVLGLWARHQLDDVLGSADP